MTSSDARVQQIRQWLTGELGQSLVRLEPASADASFRRYFRAWRADGSTRVVMDAPPDKENIAPYLKVARLLEACGVHVPQVEAVDLQYGLVLLEDLGSTQYLTKLRAGQGIERLYADALEALLRIQLRGRDAAHELPPYDRAALEREMSLMPEWFCTRHLGLTLDDADLEVLRATFDFLAREALAQPTVFVHRDYHSRNLMWLAHDNPGVVDFQDALAGAVGYDLVSLLKDCYIDWPRTQVERWVSDYRARLRGAGELAGTSEREFLRWFDLIGLQRHIKVLGIFARLWYRDGKHGYLADLPRTLAYVVDAADRYAETSGFSRWLQQRIVPAFASANARALTSAGA
ncbi:MAG: aminoglycoside phosphotransferase family protein [Steroidobacteraceae bacterium]